MGDVDGTIVYTLIATPGTPAADRRQAQRRAQRRGRHAGEREDLRKRGFVAMGGTPEELAKWTAVQAPVWGPVLQAAGMKPE